MSVSKSTEPTEPQKTVRDTNLHTIITNQCESLRKTTGNLFFVGVAGYCALLTFAGFIPTYWGPLIYSKLEGIPAAVHIHGILFFSWIIFFSYKAGWFLKGPWPYIAALVWWESSWPQQWSFLVSW